MTEPQTINAKNTVPLATHLEVASATDVGRVRELNEDSVWGEALEDVANNPWRLSALLLVADGMGGHHAGEVASGLAAQKVREIFASPQAEPSPEDLEGQKLLQRVSESVQYVNHVIYAQSEGNGAARPGTTLTVCLVRAEEYVVGHVGDSRAYLIRRNAVEQVTEDDSLVAEAVRRGHMSEAEARSSQFRNQITKAVGLRPDVEPSVYYGHWESGDVLLLCSDGLTEYVAPQEMLALAQTGDSLEQMCRSLIALANERGGHDNISVAAARYLPTLGNGAAPQRKPQTWPPVTTPERVTSPAISVASAASAAARVLDRPEKPKRTDEQDGLKGRSQRAPQARVHSGHRSHLGPRDHSDHNRPFWILLTVILAALSTLIGLWIGKSSVRSTVGNEGTVAATVPPNKLNAPHAPGAPARPSITDHAAPASYATPQVELLFFKKPPMQWPAGLEIRCPGFNIVAMESKKNGRRRPTKISRFEKGDGAKGYVEFLAPEGTAKELKAGGHFQVYRGIIPTDSTRQGVPLEQGGHVPLLLGNGQYSIYLIQSNGKPLREPTVTFSLQRMKEER